jgi:hypothetical protein
MKRTHEEKIELSKRDYYRTPEGELMVKVVNFPLAEVQLYRGTRVGQESMWVQVIEGDIHKGIGVVMNTPHFDNCAATLGDLISYTDEGQPSKRPHFDAVVEQAEG